jgi:hypothetical protein
MASATAAIPVPAILFQFHEYLSCLFMAASCLASTQMSNERPQNRHIQYFLELFVVFQPCFVITDLR